MRSFCNELMPSDAVHLSRAELEEVYRDALVRIAILEQQLQEEQEQFDELLDSFTQLYGELYG